MNDTFTPPPPMAETTWTGGAGGETPKTKRKFPAVAALLGVLLLLGGIGAGLFLVNQQQLLNQKAAAPTPIACTVPLDRCMPGTTGLSGSSICWIGNFEYSCCSSNQTIQNGVCVGGTSSGGGGATATATPTPPGGGSTTTTTGGGGFAATATAAPKNLDCGSTCKQDSDCIQQASCGAGGGCIHAVCAASTTGGPKTCQNPSCIGHTQGGSQCNCTNLNACGQPCSAAVGLCQAGFSCRYIVGPNCSPNSNQSSPTNTYCVPDPVPSDWQKISCVATDPSNFYVLNSSGRNPTVSDIQAVCGGSTPALASVSATVTPSPTVSPTPTPTGTAVSTAKPTNPPVPVTGDTTPVIVGVAGGILLLLAGLVFAF